MPRHNYGDMSGLSAGHIMVEMGGVAPPSGSVKQDPHLQT